MTLEHSRLQQSRDDHAPWRLWGPYLSERQWGTVREDYSSDGSAWTYFPHDHARSRAYRWGEDGIAGISDNRQLLCFSLALWNEHDPILKERLFGLSGPEGNHGEDVKELYHYLDATPTASYLKMLYKYPHQAYPYARLVEENRRRSRNDPEFELLDTGLFDDGRYFDISIEYAKASPTDILIQITAHNRGPEAAPLHLLPQLFFRNTWSWDHNAHRPSIRATGSTTLQADHPDLGNYTLHCDGSPTLLFCDNETNFTRLYGTPNTTGHPKDSFHTYLIDQNPRAVNPSQSGTKSTAHYKLLVPDHSSQCIRLRLTSLPSPGTPGEGQGESSCKPRPRSSGNGRKSSPFSNFELILSTRLAEADAFYDSIPSNLPITPSPHHPLTPSAHADLRLLHRQSFAGLIWSKQFYHLDIPRWLNGDPSQPAPPVQRKRGRNSDWPHLNHADILSMPDKWEYPWYAAWDLAFHMIPFAHIDPDFAKDQLILLTREWYMHPSGQLPAYEWAFSDVNPPVHAWAAWKVYQIDAAKTGRPDTAFLERVFHKCLLNFTWWVNRKDKDGRNVFQGGFLGLDNVGVFDRSAPLPTGGHLSQADGTAWMAMYSLNLMRIALELSLTNPSYQDLATKFFEHFLYIAAAMNNIGGSGIPLWDETDGFYYDVLCCEETHEYLPLKLRSMVGLIPLFAVEVLTQDLLDRVPEFNRRLEWFLNYRPDLANLVSRWHVPGQGHSHLLSLLRGHRMKCLLRRALDENEFLSPYGIRSLSKHHEANPYHLHLEGNDYVVRYEPAESSTGLFGGNSNWRGPVWFPTNYLLIDSLRQFHAYYGDDFLVEHPHNSGRKLPLNQIADDLATRLCRVFLKDQHGNRPLNPQQPLLGTQHFSDHLIFPEYFHGDTGRALGASHQTGWTALVADLLIPSTSDAAPGQPTPELTRSM